MRLLFTILILTGMMTIASCDGGKKGLPADVVNIPNTASGEADLSAMPRIEFDRNEHDFGKVIQGEKVTYSFKFRNTGRSDLFISNISATCGCTVTDYPRIPIKPGEENYVKVTFDSSGKQGFQNKEVVVMANTQPADTRLRVTANVFLP
jgi:hypothetical protein